MMERDRARALIHDLYATVLRREPREAEWADWSEVLIRGISFEEVFLKFVNSSEYKSFAGVRTKFPLGHYHSPIVDPKTIVSHLAVSESIAHADFAAIKIDPTAMAALWSSQSALLSATPFPAEKTAGKRYCYSEGPYPLGDATVLRLMMTVHRPQRIIEIGSGFSSACILDCAEELGLHPFHLKCIEPFPDRLRRLIRADDPVTVIQKNVQDVPIEIFDDLDEGDILLVDSSHIIKTGSDVCHEIFNIYPRLRAGVVVHVHDCQFPFEYPRRWAIEENFSWNEIYGLRAFLMYNDHFSVYFWNNFFAKAYTDLARSVFPGFLSNPGGAIWLTVN